MIVLDASALIAVLMKERGAEKAAPFLGEAGISAVNLAEVLSRFARDGLDEGRLLRQLLDNRAVEVVPFETADARQVADLVAATRAQGLSLGDRACLALARQRGMPAMTADRAWLDVDAGVEVVCIR